MEDHSLAVSGPGGLRAAVIDLGRIRGWNRLRPLRGRLDGVQAAPGYEFGLEHRRGRGPGGQDQVERARVE